MVAMGAGAENVDGVLAARACEPSVAHTVAANGQWDVMGLTGAVSSDGNTAALGGITMGGEDPSLFVLIK